MIKKALLTLIILTSGLQFASDSKKEDNAKKEEAEAVIFRYVIDENGDYHILDTSTGKIVDVNSEMHATAFFRARNTDFED